MKHRLIGNANANMALRNNNRFQRLLDAAGS